MSLTSAFTPQGNTFTLTAAVSAPTPVQVGSNSQYRILNTGAVVAFLGVGTTATLATTNSAVITTSGAAVPLLPGTDEVLTLIPNAFITAATASGTAVLYVTPGEGL